MRRMTLYLVLLIVAIVGARVARTRPAPPVEAPRHLLKIAFDALQAGSEIQTSGDVAGALLRHPAAAANAATLRRHFDARKNMFEIGRKAGVRYTGNSLRMQVRQFCGDNATARLVVVASIEHPMEAIPPNAGTPAMTVSNEEHVFRFVRHGEHWKVTEHHEITLAELHDVEAMERLRGACDPDQVILTAAR